jgi:uncharacterized damage-inducible protein DinB
MPVLHALQQAREDLAKYTEGLTTGQLWATPHGFGSAGFHIRHIAGSTDRLMTYAQGRELNEEQFAQLRAEQRVSGASREELLALLEESLSRAEAAIRRVDAATLAEPRLVGRQKLPTTVIGLLVHIAEHTQRHVGQAISACKLASVAR